MRAFGFLAALALSSCGDRRSFDERYNDTQRNLEERAQNLDEAANSTDGNAPAD